MLLRLSLGLFRRQMARVRERQSLGFIKRNAITDEIDEEGPPLLKLLVNVGKAMDDEADRRGEGLVDGEVTRQMIVGG